MRQLTAQMLSRPTIVVVSVRVAMRTDARTDRLCSARTPIALHALVVRALGHNQNGSRCRAHQHAVDFDDGANRVKPHRVFTTSRWRLSPHRKDVGGPSQASTFAMTTPF
jgi:uncharacterized membrane-anchored protein